MLQQAVEQEEGVPQRARHGDAVRQPATPLGPSSWRRPCPSGRRSS